MAGKFALLLGNDQYNDEQFGPLTVPGNDVKALKAILEDPTVGGFDRVDILLNASLEKIMAAMGDLFAEKNKDDLLLLYFSGHGALDRAGQLYLAVNQTQFKKLSSTAVWASIIKNEMNNSRSRRQVLILDCCHSGAFGRDSSGAKSALGAEVINETTFDVKGYGREILVSSAATQLSWEGDKVIGETDKSLFTHYLVEGLNSGKAAVKGDQEITVGQLYEYAYAKVVNAAANMTPQRWVDKLEGSIIIAKNPHPQVKEIPLAQKLLAALEDDLPYTREGAVRELGRFISGKNKDLANAAIDKLKSMLDTERDIYVLKAIEKLVSAYPDPTNTKTVKQAEKKKQDFSESQQEKKQAQINVFRPEILKSHCDNIIEPAKNNTEQKWKSLFFVMLAGVLLSLGIVFQDALKDGSKGPEMVVISKGKFRMGDIQGNGGKDEKPLHQVNIKHPFALSKYPVTFDDYAVFVKDKGKRQPDDEGWGRGNRPVINVSWEDATAYAQWLSDQTGEVYRLPSEAEWEYAARAGTETIYWWEDEIGVNNANFYGSGSEWSGKKTSSVDSFKSNPFGLHDMSGNVWEWVQDAWHENYKGAPEDDSVWEGGDDSFRVLRGGSWNSLPADVRSAARGRGPRGFRGFDIGFRLAQDL